MSFFFGRLFVFWGRLKWKPCEARRAARLGRNESRLQKPVAIGAARDDELLRGAVFLLPAVLEPKAVPVHFQDMDMMGEAIQQRSGQPL